MKKNLTILIYFICYKFCFCQDYEQLETYFFDFENRIVSLNEKIIFSNNNNKFEQTEKDFLLNMTDNITNEYLESYKELESYDLLNDDYVNNCLEVLRSEIKEVNTNYKVYEKNFIVYSLANEINKSFESIFKTDKTKLKKRN